MRIPIALTIVVIAAAGTGCDNPTSVGVELIDARSGAPEVVEIVPSLVPDPDVPDITGTARRVLLGQVDDPLLGAARAKAVIDFVVDPQLLPPVGFADSTVTAVELLLVRNYVYGDTTSTLEITISEVPTAWDESVASAQIPVGDPITTAAVGYTDTVAVSMPAEWVSANNQTLRSTNWVASFHGLHVEASSGDMILGFSSTFSSMWVTSGAGSTRFATSRSLTMTESAASSNTPEGLVALTDGSGIALRIGIDFEAEGLSGSTLARVAMRLPFDSLALTGQTPANFFRPQLSTLELAGVNSEGVTQPIATGTREDGALVFDSALLRLTFQDAMIGSSPYEKFVVIGPLIQNPVENTMSSMLLTTGLAGTPAPALVLTVIKPAEL